MQDKRIVPVPVPARSLVWNAKLCPMLRADRQKRVSVLARLAWALGSSGAPREPPGEAAEGLPSTETWEFKAAVAETVTAALVKAMPRIIVEAVTGHTS